MRTQENTLRGVPYKNTGVLGTTTEILKPDKIVPLSKVSCNNNKVSDEDHRKSEKEWKTGME
jgi:hypothetical protein